MILGVGSLWRGNIVFVKLSLHFSG
jgi:hypothetical protein